MPSFSTPKLTEKKPEFQRDVDFVNINLSLLINGTFLYFRIQIQKGLEILINSFYDIYIQR